MKKLKKPQLGIKPQFLWEEERIVQLKEAIKRYLDANQPIPMEIIEEYNEKTDKLEVEID